MRILITVMAIIASLSSCDTSRKEQNEVVKEWIGKEIVFPENMVYSIGGDTVDPRNLSADFTVVTYIDSSGCTPCRMRLREWDETINRLNSLSDFDVRLVMVVNSSLREDVDSGIENRKFLHPMAEDAEGVFDKANNLPSKESYRTFLLNSDNEVVILGNPVTNPKIEDVYIKAITESSGLQSSNAEKRLCPNPVKPIGVVYPGEKVHADFRFFNHDSVSYSIQEMVASCDCMCVTASVSAMAPSEGIKINTTFTADSTPGVLLRHIDVYFNEINDPIRLKIHGFIK